MLSSLRFSLANPARRALVWLFLSLMALPWLAQAQCPTGDERGDVYLRSQAEVNAFPPGCTNLPGALFIEALPFENNDITDLRPLSALQSINRGGLIIARNTSLTTLTGLSSLTRVNGTLRISENPVLTDLTGLIGVTQTQNLIIRENNQLASLAGLTNLTKWITPSTLAIGGNPLLTSIASLSAVVPTQLETLDIEGSQLTNLTGLEKLTNVRFLSIQTNPVLTSLASLSGLTQITQLNIRDNDQLTNLIGLDNLIDVANLFISDNPSLTSIASLSGLTQPGNNLTIANNGRLTNLTGLDNVTRVGGNLQIFENSRLTSLASLSSVTQTVGQLYIRNNAQLTNLMGLSRLTNVGGDLIIESNPSLTSVADLSGVTQTGGDVRILGNARLGSLTGLGNLTRVGKTLRIDNNSVLTSIASLSALTQTGTDVLFYNNPQLGNLTGLNKLTTVGGNLVVSGNPVLTSIADLSALTQTGGNFQIANNARLTNLTGLSRLTRVGDGLRIETNPVLTSIASLSALTQLRYLVIRNNTQLSQCAIDPVCQFLAISPQNSIIGGNAAGCSSVAEVQNMCATPLAITTQPPSQSAVCAGSTVMATVSTKGNAQAYQWYKSNQAVSGQTSATLALTSVQPADAGTYRVVVSNSVSSLTSTAFTLTVTLSPSPDYQPLVDLYNSTNGAGWTQKDNWVASCSPCGWYGVTCDGNGRVTRLNLIGNNLSGTLPASLSAISALQSLELGANALTGGIPTGIGSLTALQTLNLSRTQLGGTLPASLGQLTWLQNLLLNESALTGPLPVSLGNLAQLQNLQLYSNQLSGCFPGSYTSLCGRAQISFANNPGLPGGGDFSAFCSNGSGSELVVSQYPQSGNACVGNPFNFSVVARGAGSYQWYKLGPGQGQFQQLAESGPVLRFASVTSADAGNYQVYINYGCRPGAVQSDVVTLTVPQPGTGGCAQLNTAPVATANASQTATAGRAFSYTVSAFTDTDTPNSLTYAASLDPANSGLTFDPATRVISGTPGQPGPVSVTVTATDPGGLSASTSFSINVGPRIVGSTPLRVTLTASPQTLLTTGSTVLRATASGGNVGAPPSGYTYNFSGPGDFATSQANEVTVTNLPAGVQTFTVVVADASTPTSQTTSAAVSVTVTEANTVPTVATAIPPQSATVGQAFSYVIPASTFTDGQTPNSLTLSVSGLPQGMSFTAPTTISGTPSVSGTSTVTVTATDPGGLSANTSFVLTVRPAPVVVTPLALTLTASPATLPTSGSTTLSATVSGGTAPYRYSFTGPGTITQSTTSNTARVTSLPAGVQTFTVVVNDATTPTGQTITRTVSVTVNAPAATTALRVLHQDADNSPANNAIKPNLQIDNIGSTPIDYGQLTLRYWLTVEQFAPLTNLQVYYAQLGTDKVKMTYVALDKPRQGAFGYVEYRFEGAAGSLAAGTSSGPIQSGIAKQDYTAFNEANDYSFANNRNLTANSRITAYLGGQLVWGTEPAEVAGQRIVKAYTENKNGASTNTISTYLQVRNEGNVAVSYSDLKVRYYFTSEGNQPLNFYLDYAVLGNQKIASQFVRLSPALNQADTYLELSFSPSLGTFSPGSSTGNIQYRIAKQDWSNFTQSNDYSYQNGTQPLTENGRVVIYVSGQRVWGQEPVAGARIGTEEYDTSLRVTVLGNPVQGATANVEVRGAEGQPLRLQLTDLSGRLVSEQVVEQAGAVERHTIGLGTQPAGLLLLQVSTPTQTRTVKLIKAE